MARTARWTALAGLLALVLTGCRVAGLTGFESGNLRACTQENPVNGTLTAMQEQRYSGSRSARAHWNGSTSNGYARCVFRPYWTNQTIFYGMAIRLAPGFYANQQGEVDLMRYDNYTLNLGFDRGGIVIYGSDHRARLIGSGAVIGSPFKITEGAWHRLRVRQRLSTSSSRAVNRVWLDDRLVVNTTTPNSVGHPFNRIRFGIVAISAGHQTRPLTVYIDNLWAGSVP